MDLNKYQKEVKRTENKSLIKRDTVLQKIMGIAGESGEIVDLFKKHFFQEQELDKDKVIEEIGDLMWYIAGLCNEMDLELGHVLYKNIMKLQKRYPEGFDKEKSKYRGQCDK